MTRENYKRQLRIRNKLRILSISLLLSAIVFITVYANGTYSPTTGAGTSVTNGVCAGGDGSGGAHLVTLVAIPNEMKNDAEKAKKEEFKDAAGVYVGDTTATLLKSYRNKIDTENIFNSANLAFATFYPRQGWSNYVPNTLIISINDGNGSDAVYNPINNQYDGTPYGMEGIRPWKDNWWNDTETWQNYSNLMNGGLKSQGLDWDDRSPEMAEKYIEYVFGADNGLWQNANKVSEYIYSAYANNQEKVNSDFYNYTTPTGSRGERGAGYTLAYYTAVIIKSEQQHNKNYSVTNNLTWKNLAGRELLKKYWINRNEDGKSSELIILASLAVAGQNEGGKGHPAHVYSYVAALNNAGLSISSASLSSWLEEKYPSMKSSIEGGYTKANAREREKQDITLIREKTGIGSKVIGKQSWMYLYFSNNYIAGNSGVLAYTGSSKGYWTEPMGWESALRMVDARRNVIGPPGVNYIAGRPDNAGGATNTSHPATGNNKISPNAPDLSISCEPRLQKVETPGSTSNMVSIKLKSNVQQDKMDQIYSYFNTNYLSKDPNSTMQIKYALSSQVLEGNPGDTIAYNVLSQGSGSFTPTGNNTFLSSTKLTSAAQLKDFLSGSKSQLTLQDTSIKVDNKVTMKYIASMYVCMNGNGKHEDYQAEPKGVNIEGSAVYDTATLYTKSTPYFYSDMRHKPVAEIKADKPYGEKYEAMAGVPTTTNIYLGTGATEYMVNVDLEVKTTTTGVRTYTFKVTENQCYGDNTACTYTSCPGPLTDDKGVVTHPVHSKSCAYLGTVKADSITDHRNNKHPGVCNYTYTITQNIDPITYMDITAEDLYRLIDFKLAGNNKLQNPSSITLAPNLGYYSYHTQENYSNGNGRFRFSVSLDGSNGQYWGNTTKQIASGTVNGTHDKCKQDACNAINAVVSTLTNNTATVVSDYVVLETSEGYQNVMYYELTSNNVPLNGLTVTPANFGNHADMSTSNLSYNRQAPNITWPKQPTQDDMWKNNANSSAKWDPTHITTTGYNGEYDSVLQKYNNSNSTSGSLIARKNVDLAQPNLNKLEGDTDFEGNKNSRYIKEGINILDSTTPPPNRQWSATDSTAPVTNGEWNTGNVTVLYKKDISYKNSNGVKWDSWTTRREAPYSEEHDKVNNIVIHNPLSNRDAVVISNDEKYDQRWWGELDKPTLPDNPTICPGDATCVYSTLTCNKSSPHTEACFKNIDVGLKCNNLPLNTSNTVWHWLQGNEIGTSTWYFYRSGCTYSPMTFTIPGPGPATEALLTQYTSYSHDHNLSASSFTLVSTTPGTNYKYVNHTLEGNDYKGKNGVLYFVASEKSGWDGDIMQFRQDHKYVIVRPDSGAAPWSGWYHVYDETANECLSCKIHGSSHTTHRSCHGPTITELDLTPWASTTTWSHVHTSACYRKEKVLTCTDPHHYHLNSEPHDVKDPANHYPFADQRCYTACHDDSKHNPPKEINLPGGQKQSTTGVFINIDREFKIYYPDLGDFQQQPKLNGISECVDEKGLGYKNNTDTDTWLRNKFVIYPFNTVDAANNLWGSGEPIDLLKLPDTNKVYEFTCLLANNERSACTVLFHSVANNAPEVYSFDDATSNTNFDRYTNHGAKMSVTKKQDIDVVGSIGSLTIEDVGDPRFAELFKKPKNNGKWLIPNVVKEVDYSLPNKIVSDDKDARNEDATSTGKYHSVYGVTDMPTGGKSFPYAKLPLTPSKNPITELQKEEMRPGYNLYMDIETIGNYYGQNYREDGGDVLVPWERGADSSGMFTYKMQIKPKYWELNLDTGKYNEVDAYMQQGSTFLPIVLSDKTDQTSEYYYYLDWLNESSRRSFTPDESARNRALQSATKTDQFTLRMPTNNRDLIGSADRLYLIDLDRTFIGSSFRYGKDLNTGNTFAGTSDNRIDSETSYTMQSQRWHWTLGLPSSTVFVRAGKACNNTNIKALQDTNSVILCSLDIKVRGEVWTLNYDGSSVNTVDGTGFKIYPGGKTYNPPIDPVTNKPIDDPIVVVYNNKRTSKDDIQTQGSH